MVKLVILTILFSTILIVLKNVNSDLFVPALVCSGVVIASFGITYLNQAYSFITSLIDSTKIDVEFYKILFKVVGIAYLIEFGASTVEEVGYKSLADKLVMVGKIIIFIVSMPIFYAIFNLLGSLTG
ncbi:MAG: hypothetical protein IJW43_04765 [Clostridia bacterium]|nr:hypothetical protein [Clostridia bacterium]